MPKLRVPSCVIRHLPMNLPLIHGSNKVRLLFLILCGRIPDRGGSDKGWSFGFGEFHGYQSPRERGTVWVGLHLGIGH